MADSILRRTTGRTTYKISSSFTLYHEELLDIVFKKTVPCLAKVEPVHDPSCLTIRDLDRLALMVKADFAASLGAEPNDDEAPTEPHPFDVFEMEKSPTRHNSTIAVCLPLQKPKRALMWHDANGNFWPIQPQTHIRRIASLSGCARVLQVLAERPIPHLMALAMQRQSICEVCDRYLPIVTRTPYSAFCDHLNESQKLAVATVLSPRFNQGFFVVQGPPGTGKTATAVSMIRACRLQQPSQTVLVTAPSNAAVGNVALKLFASTCFDQMDLVVHGENCDDSVKFLNPIHRGRKYLEYRNEVERINPDDAKTRLRLFRGMAHWLHLDDPSRYTEQDIARLCPFFDMEELPSRRAYSKALSDAQAVFCTLNSAGSPVIQNALEGIVGTLLLDEAGQCSEADFYIAASFPGLSRIIAIGDPAQLPATVIQQVCKSAGYGESWIGQVFKHFRHKVHLLNTQYRMDPPIVAFPNEKFYQNQLMSGDSVSNRHPVVEQAFCFVDTKGYGGEETDGKSFRNSYETVVIRSILKTDADIKRVRAQAEDPRTIIITPYRAQAEHLKDQIDSIKGLGKVDVSTVDSFQGQEGDIVIVSTVRTSRVGFVDNAQRLNVALTRAKRVLRVVGCASFFKQQHRRSILRSLVLYCEARQILESSKVSSIAWCKPNFTNPTLWEPVLTQRFHSCFKSFARNESDQNTVLNVIFAIAKPNVRALHSRLPERRVPSWYLSALKGHDSIWVVWVLKNGRTVEAHFAGRRKDCLRFIQRSDVPRDAQIAKQDLTGFIVLEEQNQPPRLNRDPAKVWKLTNRLQSVLSKVTTLPQGTFHLDDVQNDVVRSAPPIIIESRSGTGKTNVLFQHALAHAKASMDNDTKPICFITVSARLAVELQNRFEEAREVEGKQLPTVMFFSFREFLSDCLKTFGVKDADIDNVCSFREYLHQRSSHEKLSVDATLVENEIGGVITGSVQSALHRRPLSRTEYLHTKRSNISNKNRDGLDQRDKVYDVYESYNSWKIEGSMYDMSDVVLRILQHVDGTEFFESVYLDEVQDFSYASIFLVLSLGGCSDASWICAGDTAQMISPGCSFKFQGLKETMLFVKEGIESQLRDVHHLLKNYRTTTDVLAVGNQILSLAKQHFPGAIEFTEPEVATRNLMLPVTLCDWQSGFGSKAQLGHNQALIFAADLPTSTVERDSRQWLDGHPFVLSSLESKGLEFDDVIVAFDMGRRAWLTKNRQELALRLLRELYVAVTRAKRRVVILIQRDNQAMRDFFDQLEYDFHSSGAKDVMRQFDTQTSAETWFKEAMKHFEQERFKIASSCFAAANNHGWRLYAAGMHARRIGVRDEAVILFRQAARHFSGEDNHRMVLESMILIRSIPPWDPQDDALFDRAKAHLPSHLRRSDAIQFALARERWNEIVVSDLIDLSTITYLAPFRRHEFLQKLIGQCSQEERKGIQNAIPLAVADWCSNNGETRRACALYLLGRSYEEAEMCTVRATENFVPGRDDGVILGLVSDWKKANQDKNVDQTKHSSLLVALFDRTAEYVSAQQKMRASIFVSKFDLNLIRLAVRHASFEPFCLFYFHRTAFSKEVLESLEVNHGKIGVVDWYYHENAHDLANGYAGRELKSWSDDELVFSVLLRYGLRPSGWVREVAKRGKEVAQNAIAGFVEQGSDEAIEAAVQISDQLLSSKAAVLKNYQMIVQAWADNSIDTIAKAHKGTKVALLLCLDDNPEEVAFASGDAAKSFNTFGREIIWKTVLKRAPYRNDILDILVAFSRPSFVKVKDMDILKEFVKLDEIDKAKWYAVTRCTRWTVPQLKEVVFEKKIVCHELLEELAFRGMYVDLVDFHLQRDSLFDAIVVGGLALRERSNAEKTVPELLERFLRFDPGEIVHLSHFMPQENIQQNPLLTMLILWEDPTQVDQFAVSRCYRELFGPWLTRAVAVQNMEHMGRYREFYKTLPRLLKDEWKKRLERRLRALISSPSPAGPLQGLPSSQPSKQQRTEVAQGPPSSDERSSSITTATSQNFTTAKAKAKASGPYKTEDLEMSHHEVSSNVMSNARTDTKSSPNVDSNNNSNKGKGKGKKKKGRKKR